LRCLKSLLPLPENVNVLIFDDCSPKISEIENSINDFIIINNNFKLIKNTINIGYDRNLLRSIMLADGDYVFLLSDDDSLERGALSSVISSLKNQPFSVAFVSFLETMKNNPGDQSHGKYRRFWSESQNFLPRSISRDGSMVYNAILFSGLVFRRLDVVNSSNKYDAYLDSIYIQVAIFCTLMNKHGSMYISGPGVVIGGDGENGFGANSASNGDIELVDRSSIHSNLNFVKRLFKVVDSLASSLGSEFSRSFYKEFNFRSVSGMRYARHLSRTDLVFYWNNLSKITKYQSKIYKFIFYLMYLLPTSFISIFISSVASLVEFYRSKNFFK